MRRRCSRAFRRPTSRRMLDNQSLMSGVSFAVLAFGTLLFTVVHGVPAAQHDQGAHRAAAQDQLAGRSAERRRQPPRLSQWREPLFAQQAIDREPLAVLLFDLDRFKAINDRMGHAVGDQVLQTFARSRRPRRSEPTSLFGRIGGEEFAVAAAGRRSGRGLCHRRSGAPEFRATAALRFRGRRPCARP